MNKIQKAKKLILDYNFPEELKDYGEENLGSYAEDHIRGWHFDGVVSVPIIEMTPKVLADSLQYSIDIETEKMEEEDIPLGSSKIKGLPHLPSSIEWPEGYYFYTQFNFEELKEYDMEDIFPDKGILYLFYSPKKGCKAIYYDGPVKELTIRDYPKVVDKEYDEYYLKKFKNNPAHIEFSPQLIFYVGDDAYDYEDILEFIPDDLKEQIEELTGVSISDEDSSRRILGKPMYSQGEDEFWEEDGGDRKAYFPYNNILLFNDSFGEGNLHFWIAKEDLKKRNFDTIELEYSGT